MKKNATEQSRVSFFDVLSMAEDLREQKDKELDELRELREVCAMYCEQLPIEVRQALHKTAEIEKTHRCGVDFR